MYTVSQKKQDNKLLSVTSPNIKYNFVANLPSPLVKEFWKLVNIWGSYRQEFGVLFFWDTVYKKKKTKHANAITAYTDQKIYYI